MTEKEFKMKNRKRVLRQYRSRQGRSDFKYLESFKLYALALIVLIILIIFILWQ
jgi:hypothetical protein